MSRLPPDDCCAVGSYECQVPMPIRGRVCDIDLCIAPIVAALNAGNIVTVCSCCGHGRFQPLVILDDGTEMTLTNFPKGSGSRHQESSREKGDGDE